MWKNIALLKNWQDESVKISRLTRLASRSDTKILTTNLLPLISGSSNMSWWIFFWNSGCWGFFSCFWRTNNRSVNDFLWRKRRLFDLFNKFSCYFIHLSSWMFFYTWLVAPQSIYGGIISMGSFCFVGERESIKETFDPSRNVQHTPCTCVCF